ncbi:interferon phi 1 [Gouania willdenowi]|uniref:interferon phi 1 n=1 Tax=Gouania willdenowi TaxID=441366 RepID=UPI001054375B|nr:interferon a3-like [Gouania willdenowi]
MVSITLLFAATLTPALCCHWLNHDYHHLNSESITQLERMGGGAISMSKSLLPFPYILYERMERAEVSTQLVFIRDNMELILGLYRHDNLSSASWDPVSTEHFLVSIGRQRDEISSCVSVDLRADCRLRRYYNKLRRRTLSLTGGSVASWEFIRTETKHHLDQMQMLVNDMLTAASGRRPTDAPQLQIDSVSTSAPC